MNTLTDQCFNVFGNKKFEFIRMSTPTLMVARKHWSEDGMNCSKLGLLDVHDVDVDILKRHNIWDNLSKEVQNEIMTGVRCNNESTEQKTKGRKSKYPNIPRELVCSKCQAKVKIVPSILIQQVENMSKNRGGILTIDEYIKEFQCKICSPRKRGKKKNPEFANIPKTMKCKCGKEVIVNAYQLKVKAKKHNTTIQSLIDGFICQDCSPCKRGRPRKIKE